MPLLLFLLMSSLSTLNGCSSSNKVVGNNTSLSRVISSTNQETQQIQSDLNIFWDKKAPEVGLNKVSTIGKIHILPDFNKVLAKIRKVKLNKAWGAFYYDGEIAIGLMFMRLLETQNGLLEAVLAHEWGHHILKELGFEQDEAIADCLAGYYISNLKNITKKDKRGMALFFESTGDQDRSTPHPPGSVRKQAFQLGLKENLNACFDL